MEEHPVYPMSGYRAFGKEHGVPEGYLTAYGYWSWVKMQLEQAATTGKR
jgi:hypothetical protein